MYFTSVTGHIKELQFPEKYKQWEKWPFVTILKEAEIMTVVDP